MTDKETFLLTGVQYVEVKMGACGPMRVVTTGMNVYAGFYDTREAAYEGIKEQTDYLRLRAYNYVTVRRGECRTYDDTALITIDVFKWNDSARSYERMSLPPEIS